MRAVDDVPSWMFDSNWSGGLSEVRVPAEDEQYSVDDANGKLFAKRVCLDCVRQRTSNSYHNVSHRWHLKGPFPWKRHML